MLHIRVSLRIQSKCGKMWTRITPNIDTFHAVMIASIECFLAKYVDKIIT